MQVKFASVSGFCGNNGQFGVSGAIKLAQEAALSEPGKVYLLGELVHNTHVTKWLQDSYQIKIVDSIEQIPPDSILVIKAHGAPPEIFAAASEKKIRLIDATCPMVKNAQKQLRQLIEQGREVIYLASDKKHDEAISVSRQVKKGVKVVTLAKLPELIIKFPSNTVLLTQTTLSMLDTQAAFTKLERLYPELTIQPHLCAATTDRQKSVLDLANQVDLLLVIGAPHSSNSRRLLEVAATTGKPAYALDQASEIDYSWFSDPTQIIGLIAGASTPQWIIDEIAQKIRAFIPNQEQQNIQSKAIS